jgi:hypothetical protein
VTPAIVCATDTTSFAAPVFFIAANNIAGAVPAIVCSSEISFHERGRKLCLRLEFCKVTTRRVIPSSLEPRERQSRAPQPPMFCRFAESAVETGGRE